MERGATARWSIPSETTKFVRHGGKMQKELEQKRKDSEIAAAKAAKASPAPAKKK